MWWSMCFQRRLIYAQWQKHGWNRPTMSLDKSVSLLAIHPQIIPAKVAGWVAGLVCCARQTSHHLWCNQERKIIRVLWTKCPSLAIRLMVVYRPTYSKEHPFSPGIFDKEFGVYLQGVILSKEPFWLQKILIFMFMTARTRMLQNSKIYCLNLDFNNM